MHSKCPGQDSRNLRVALYKCPNCGADVEIFSDELKRIPLKQPMNNAPKVLVVGEIYVRRDDFAVDELIQLFSKKGIIGKVSGVTEWIYYCDYVRYYKLKKILKRIDFEFVNKDPTKISFFFRTN